MWQRVRSHERCRIRTNTQARGASAWKTRGQEARVFTLRPSVERCHARCAYLRTAFSCLFFERLINFLFRSSIFFIDHDRASIVVPSLLLGGLPDEQLPWLCVTFCFVVCCTCLDTKWQKEKQKRSSIYYLSLHRRLVSRSCRARVVLGESIVFRDVDQQQRWK